MEIVTVDMLQYMLRIAEALERIAENTKPEKINERDYRVKGFNGDDLNGGGNV